MGAASARFGGRSPCSAPVHWKSNAKLRRRRPDGHLQTAAEIAKEKWNQCGEQASRAAETLVAVVGTQ